MCLHLLCSILHGWNQRGYVNRVVRLFLTHGTNQASGFLTLMSRQRQRAAYIPFPCLPGYLLLCLLTNSISLSMVIATATDLLYGSNSICLGTASTKMTSEGCYNFFRFLAPGWPLLWCEQCAGPLLRVLISEDQPTLVVAFGRCSLQCAMQTTLLALQAAYRPAA